MMHTISGTKVYRFHVGHIGWRRAVVAALVCLDEFFCGRWRAVCYWRTVLGNRWDIWE